MEHKKAYLPDESQLEQTSAVDVEAIAERTTPQQVIEGSSVKCSVEVLQQVITVAILEANRTLKEDLDKSKEKETQCSHRKNFSEAIKSFIEGIKITVLVIFAPRKYLPQTKADTDTLVHTYTMLVHTLATLAWYIAGILLWLMAILRLIPNLESTDGTAGSSQKIYYLIHSVDAAEALMICLPMGFVFLGVGGLFRLVSDSLARSKDMDKNGRVMALDVAVITAFITVVAKYFIF